MGNYRSKHQTDRIRKDSHAYFDSIEYKKIRQMVNLFPKIAYERSLAYIEKYPEDFLGNTLYISILLRLGKIKEADEYLDRVINSRSFRKRKTERDLKVVESLKKQIEMRSISDFNDFILYAKQVIPKESYLGKQLENYSFEAFMEHINRHIDDDDDDKTDTEKSRAIFRYELDIYRIIEEVQKNLNNAPKRGDVYADIYYFKFDGCGRYRGKTTDYFEVVCIRGTHNIITMYPVPKCSLAFCTNLNYLYEEGYQPESRIQKFLRKYNKNS